MSRRQSSATEEAVKVYKGSDRRWKRSARLRRELAAGIALGRGIHKTTLYRALGWYRTTRK
jgi:hypothetical protein